MRGKLTKILTHPATLLGGMGTANAGLWDWLQNEDVDIPFVDSVRSMLNGGFDSERYKRLGVNALTGAIGGAGIYGGIRMSKDNPARMATILAGATEPLVATPLKDALIPVPETLHTFRKNQRLGTALKAALGIGGLGLGAAALAKYLTSRDSEGDVAKARYKIQGKPGDPYSDAEIEVPIDDPAFSDSMLADIGKNVRNQARKNLRSNTTKMDPKTGQQIPFDDWDRKYGNLTEEALRELKQKHGTLKNVSTDDKDESGFFDWGKSAAAIYLRTNVIKQASASMPPQPVQPMGAASVQPPPPAGPNPIQAKMTRPVPAGSTPSASSGIAAAGSPDIKNIHRSVSDITRKINTIAQSATQPHTAQQTTTPSSAQTAPAN